MSRSCSLFSTTNDDTLDTPGSCGSETHQADAETSRDEVASYEAWSRARAQPLFHPEALHATQFRIGLGALVDILPSRVTESELRQIPQLTVHGRLGLGRGLSLSTRMRGNLIANELAVGLGYSFALGPVWLGISDYQGAWIGYLGVEDAFSATGWAFTNTPSVAAGLTWHDTYFSLTVDSYFTFPQHTTLGDSTRVSRQRSVAFSGFAATLAVENILRHGGAIYYGAGILQTLPDYQVWVAFSDERARLVYPRMVAGYVF